MLLAPPKPLGPALGEYRVGCASPLEGAADPLSPHQVGERGQIRFQQDRVTTEHICVRVDRLDQPVCGGIHQLRGNQDIPADRKAHESVRRILEGVHQPVGHQEIQRVEQLVLDLPGAESDLRPGVPVVGDPRQPRPLVQPPLRAVPGIGLEQHRQVVDVDLWDLSTGSGEQVLAHIPLDLVERFHRPLETDTTLVLLAEGHPQHLPHPEVDGHRLLRGEPHLAAHLGAAHHVLLLLPRLPLVLLQLLPGGTHSLVGEVPAGELARALHQEHRHPARRCRVREDPPQRAAGNL